MRSAWTKMRATVFQFLLQGDMEMSTSIRGIVAVLALLFFSLPANSQTLKLAERVEAGCIPETIGANGIHTWFCMIRGFVFDLTTSSSYQCSAGLDVQTDRNLKITKDNLDGRCEELSDRSRHLVSTILLWTIPSAQSPPIPTTSQRGCRRC